MTWSILAPALLSACGVGLSNEAAYDMRGASAPVDAAESARVTLQLNLAPSNLRESESGAYRVLPQTFGVTTLQSAARISVGSLVLESPVVQTGSASAYKVNPSVAALPGDAVPVAGRVRLFHPASVQSYVTETDLDGRFETWAVPGAGYRLEIVPFDPLLPVFTEEIGVTDPPTPLDRDLGAGVPIYGLVTTPSGPVEGARIQLVDDFGTISATAFSDAYGIYQIRATKGVWTVVCSGRDSGLDPILAFVDQTVGELGLNLDVAYPTELEAVLTRGEIESVDGDRLAATVRLVAESLDGYTGFDAAFATEVFASSNGSFLGEVVPGIYTVDVLPPDEGGDDLSPRRLTGVRLGDGIELDGIQLEGRVEVGGEVRGPSGPLAASRVVCDEVGFGERSWDTFTGEQGRFLLDLPRVRVACEAHPPGDRSQLAPAFLSFDPSVEQSVAFDLVRGQVVAGTVVADDGEPEPTVVVEVRDASGRVLGSGLTGAEGQFEIAVDLSSL
jgi:hypothetical protein